MFDRSTENGNDMVQKVDEAIHRIILYLTDSTIILILIHWIVICLVDSAVQHLNNWGQNYQCYHCKKTNCQ